MFIYDKGFIPTLLLIIGILFTCSCLMAEVRAADDKIKPKLKEVPTQLAIPRSFLVSHAPYHNVGVHTAFNIDDVFIGLNGAGNIAKGIDLALIGSFEMRPTAKRVLVKTMPDTYLQLQERRFLPAVGIEKRFEVHELFDVFASASIGYLLGDFKGTRRDTEDGPVFIPKIGLSWKPGKNGLISFGYQYQSIYDEMISPHRVFVSFGVRWN